MKKGWLISVIVVVLLLAVAYFGNLFHRPISGPNAKGTKMSLSTSTLKVITAKRVYSNGTHVVSGEVDLPTPCHTLSVDTTITKTSPEQVALNFHSSTTAEQCAQVVTPVKFRQEFNASGYAIIRAYWNGEPAKLEFTQ